MFAFKVGGKPFEMCGDLRLYTLDVLRVHPVQPFLWAVSDLAVL
jgi:hypothetical protein